MGVTILFQYQNIFTSFYRAFQAKISDVRRRDDGLFSSR